MIAEGTASFTKLKISCKASFEKPVQVFAQVGEYFTYIASRNTLIQFEIVIAKAAPLLPSPDLKTRPQHTIMCSKDVAPELSIIGKTLFWVCNNLLRH
jgi:hypothetical protein